MYTGAFIGEIVRAGILAVPKGQSEAARSLGLRQNIITRLVIVPQALRVVIPPLTSQYLNLTKNTTLAAAISYWELQAGWGGTVLNQTSREIEIVLSVMVTFLLISLFTSLMMNIYNRRTALKER
jgi:general L-amino acid transport system permease protein